MENTFALLGCSAWSPTLTVSNKGGSNTATGSVTVTPAPPNAKFGDAYADQVHPLTWYFSVDRSSGFCLTHQWNFGDPASGSKNSATTSGDQGTQHTYSGPGTYSVAVTVSNSAGSSTAAKTITVAGGSGSGSPPPAQTPVINAVRDPNYEGVDVNGSKFTPNTPVQININQINENKSVGALLASVTVPADKNLGTFDQQFISEPTCTGSTGFTIAVQAKDSNGTLSNVVTISC